MKRLNLSVEDLREIQPIAVYSSICSSRIKITVKHKSVLFIEIGDGINHYMVDCYFFPT